MASEKLRFRTVGEINENLDDLESNFNSDFSIDDSDEDSGEFQSILLLVFWPSS